MSSSGYMEEVDEELAQQRMLQETTNQMEDDIQNILGRSLPRPVAQVPARKRSHPPLYQDWINYPNSDSNQYHRSSGERWHEVSAAPPGAALGPGASVPVAAAAVAAATAAVVSIPAGPVAKPLTARKNTPPPPRYNPAAMPAVAKAAAPPYATSPATAVTSSNAKYEYAGTAVPSSTGPTPPPPPAASTLYAHSTSAAAVAGKSQRSGKGVATYVESAAALPPPAIRGGTGRPTPAALPVPPRMPARDSAPATGAEDADTATQLPPRRASDVMLQQASTSTSPPPLPLRPPAVPKRNHLKYGASGSKAPSSPPYNKSSSHHIPPVNGCPPTPLPQRGHRSPKCKTAPILTAKAVTKPLADSRKLPNYCALASTCPSGTSLLDSSTLVQSHLFNNNPTGTMLVKNYPAMGEAAENGTAAKLTTGPKIANKIKCNEQGFVGAKPSAAGPPCGLGGGEAGTTASKPPPLVVANGPIHKSMSNSKISVRQDSNVSSDSFSQTSSPSYTTKTMEAPLLPNHQTVASRSNHYNGNICGQTTAAAAKKEKAKGDDTATNGSSITKSASTPASLQTIVRFHNGSNMSLHHRIIRDMRRPSSHYASGVRFRFRFAQVLINAIALLAISGGLAAYFKAYPTSVQVVSTNVTSKSIAPPVIGSNPAPGICLPVIVSFCLNYKVPYNFTVFPNYMGHFSQRDAQQELEVYDAVVDVRCYELAALFLCSVFVPKCGHTGQVVRPCRSLCFETKRRCGFFLDVFGLSLPDYLECGLFPESTDPEVCVGHKEVKDAKLRAQKPVCNSGFKCDMKRCIPADWQCDGHVDCKDQSDELNCKQCPRGMIHCGEEHCMAQEHMCDGIVDCPWGQDERNCLRLSDANGDEGHGQLEVFMPEQQQWVPACVSRWDPVHSANEVCALLGYTAANGTRVAAPNSDMDISPPMRTHSPTWRMYKSKTSLVKEFRSCAGNTHQNINLTCTGYACGKIRKTYKEKVSKRIVGGVEAAPGDWPFLAALLGGPEEVFYCAGVLISDQWILTASHCVGNHSDVSGWTIQLGITRRHAHTYYGQKMKVRRVVPHPMYNLEVAHDNDVALFQLATRVTFHEHLLPVCLPPPNRELVPGTICTVIGWGKREDKGMSEYEPAVNEVQVPVLNRDLCNDWLEHRDLNVTEGMICAGYPEGGKDACQGDSGGPLLCRDDEDPDRWFVGGIVSWGIKCAHPHLPGVYAYVPRYISWIKQQIDLYSD